MKKDERYLKYQNMNIEKLQKELKKLKLRMAQSHSFMVKATEKRANIKELKKEVARIKTIIRERCKD